MIGIFVHLPSCYLLFLFYAFQRPMFHYQKMGGLDIFTSGWLGLLCFYDIQGWQWSDGQAFLYHKRRWMSWGRWQRDGKGMDQYSFSSGIPSFFIRFNNMPSKRRKTPDLCNYSFLALVPLEFAFAKVQFGFFPNYFGRMAELDMLNQVGTFHCLFVLQSGRFRKRDLLVERRQSRCYYSTPDVFIAVSVLCMYQNSQYC